MTLIREHVSDCREIHQKKCFAYGYRRLVNVIEELPYVGHKLDVLRALWLTFLCIR